MFEIDGSLKSGSGTILRLSVSLAAIRGQALHIINIRQNRPKPGLKPQHLQAVLTAAKLCDAELEGATLGSRELWFTPNGIRGGEVKAEIGTAGNIPMLFMTVLPMCFFAKEPVRLRVTKGGTDTKNAPTINYFRYVFLTALRHMCIEAEVEVGRYGYYPKGNGEATLSVKPTSELKPFCVEKIGKLQDIAGISVCTYLADRRVAERQAEAASRHLFQKGYCPNIQVVNDTSNTVQKGSSLALWTKTDTGAILGADAIGELKKSAEMVGEEAAKALLNELTSRVTVDTYLADMLIPYMALARGASVYLTRQVSDHLETNIWLCKKILGARFKITSIGSLNRVEKLAESDV